MRRGSNMPAVGTYNQTLVLDMIRRAPDGLSRVELAHQTGLSAQTLSNVARKLSADGLIFEGSPLAAEGPGKPRTPLQLNAQARYAVGIHLDPSVDTLVLIDLRGDVITRVECPPRSAGAPGELIDFLAHAVNELLTRAGVDRKSVLGIGVAAPGPIDTERGMLLEPPLLPAWHHVELRDMLAAAMDLPVTVEKDVVAAMVGELWFDSDHTLDDSIFFYYGAGVGVGLSVEGSPVRGRTGNAGDVAHIVVGETGPLCSCGSRGCLGVALAPETLLAADGVTVPDSDQVAHALEDLCQRASDGDTSAEGILDHAAEALARALVILNNVLDADHAVVGGPIWSHLSSALGPRLRRSLDSSPQITTTKHMSINEAQLGTEAAAVGAACLVLDEAFNTRASHLMITPK